MHGLRALNRGKRISRSKTGTAALFVVLLIFACVMAFPTALIVANAFKPQDELWVFPPQLIPNSPTLDNFRDMFSIMSNSTVPFLRYIFNTVFITLVGTIGHIIISSMCAYPLAKKRFPGREAIFRIIVLSLMFNATVTAIPNFLTMSWLKWIDTHISLIVPALGAPIGLYLMKQFMAQIPDALIEAARIDGADQWYTFWRIVMPNVKSAWLTLFLLSFQSLWGIGNTSYIYREELKTLPYALNQILAVGISRAGVGAAVSVLMLIVPVLIFVFSQSNIVETMASSGMKD